MKNLWICGQVITQTDSGIVWDFQGVFSKEKNAIKACKNEYYFIAPINLNEEIPQETQQWPGCYYPKK